MHRALARLSFIVAAALSLAACDLDGAANPLSSVDPAVLLTREPRYTCGSFPFDPKILDKPGTAELGSDELAAALRQRTGVGGPSSSLPDSGWHLLGRTNTSAELLNMTGPEQLLWIVMKDAGGGWMITADGPCRPELEYPDRIGPASWVLDPEEIQPGPQTTRVNVLVTEQTCASGRSADGRIVGPAIRTFDDRVLIIFGALPVEGPATCQGNPSSRVVVDLPEPLGDRALVDPLYLIPERR